jgi:hypothetical protein
MLPMHELLSHAELSQSKLVSSEVVEARRSPRRSRCGNLTLFPRVERAEPVDPLEEDPQVIASISNISSTGLGMLHCDELPAGLEFDVQWDAGECWIPLRFQIVHSRRTSLGIYRTGARLIEGVMPAEPAPVNTAIKPTALPWDQPHGSAVGYSGCGTDSQSTAPVVLENESTTVPVIEEPPAPRRGGILKYEPELAITDSSPADPAPPGTFQVSAAFGFDKTERLDGVTTCGWERSVEIRRAGDRLWLYIHTPGKKNGWGIYVDPNQFESALSRVQDAAHSPFITTLAA